MSIFHYPTDLESALLVLETVRKLDTCELRVKWALTTAHPKVGDVFVIHAEDDTLRIMLWVRVVMIGETDPETKRVTLKLWVGKRP